MGAIARRADSLRIKLFGLYELEEVAAVGTIPGLAIDRAATRNGPGVGRIRSTGDGQSLSWMAPGSSTYGAAVRATSQGSYLLTDGEDPDKWLRARAWPEFLVQPSESPVQIERLHISGADVTDIAAYYGDITSWEFAACNDSSGGIRDVRLWIDPDTDGFEVSKDSVSYVSPNAEDHPDVIVWPAIGGGDNEPFYLRRTVQPGSAADIGILFLLHFSFLST